MYSPEGRRSWKTVIRPLTQLAVSMKPRLLTFLLLTLLLVPVFQNSSFPINVQAEATPDVLVGIQLGYGSIAEAKRLIDEVNSYTNLIVIGTNNIVDDANLLNEVCQYAYDKGMSFISYGVPIFDPGYLPQNSSQALEFAKYRIERTTEWLETAKEKWGNRFLGIYAIDEPAGKQLDAITHFSPSSPNTHADAASQFEKSTGDFLYIAAKRFFGASYYSCFTSDYALYWFDFKAGYDAVFAEFVWNYDRQLAVALCRGAATVQNMQWGVTITWKYKQPPYIESGEDLYKDLILAYDSGAKYIVVFDANEGYTQGILEEEHLQALQQFWQYANATPRKGYPTNGRVAYVLPKDYGYGFRGPNDKIWGLWEADALSYNLSASVGNLLQNYGDRLDIIYDDGLQPGNTYGYSKLIYWDSYSPLPPAISILSPENKTYAASNVPLNFTINEPVTWIGYSLDDQENVTVTANTTLASLPDGPHNITVFAKDAFENIGASETIYFTVAVPETFPTAPIIAVAGVFAFVIGAGLFVYFRKTKNHKPQ